MLSIITRQNGVEVYVLVYLSDGDRFEPALGKCFVALKCLSETFARCQPRTDDLRVTNVSEWPFD